MQRSRKEHAIYTYLVHPEKLEVKRVRLNGKHIFPNIEIDSYLGKGYIKTRTEIYRRHREGLLTSNSFRKVDVMVGESKKSMYTNLNLID